MLDRMKACETVARAAVGIVDIGSNSVRLVVYDGPHRSPTPIFNEKALCALGNGVASTGKLPAGAIDKALAALRRFRILADLMGVEELTVIATAAARDAKNGGEFLRAAEAAIGVPITLLSGPREAELSAYGVIGSVHEPAGIVGDLGGGSLELIEVKGMKPGKGSSLPLGGLALMDASGNSPRAAAKIARAALDKTKVLDRLDGRSFYAVGGTWRALAKLHMRQRNYPLLVMHGYVIPAREAADFLALVERVSIDSLDSIEAVNAGRRPLLVYGAVVLEEIIRRAKPRDIVISTAGVREGLLYERLSDGERQADPLLSMARGLNDLLARAPHHADDLCRWTDSFMASALLGETADEKRLRHAACLLADVNWRAHPDYRGEQAFELVAHASFSGIDHPGRAFLALATSYRHLAPHEEMDLPIRALASTRMLDRARILGAAFRVAYLISAAMPGVLGRAPLHCSSGKLILSLSPDLADLGNERLGNRLKQLAKLLGREAVIEAAER